MHRDFLLGAFACADNGSAVIVGENFLIVFPLFCQTVGAILAHTDAVTGTCGSDGNFLIS